MLCYPVHLAVCAHAPAVHLTPWQAGIGLIPTACVCFVLQVPLVMYLMTHAYFCFYHALSNLVLRRVREHVSNCCSNLCSCRRQQHSSVAKHCLIGTIFSYTPLQLCMRLCVHVLCVS